MSWQPGDLLLFRVSSSSNWLDRLIGWGQRVIHAAPTDADYCHVAIIGPTADRMYQAAWPRIVNSALDCTTVNKTILLEAYRVKGITQGQIQSVLAAAQGRVGEHYDLLAILTFGILQLGKTAVCSQYAWQSFVDAGIVLCPFESLESPDDIAASPIIQRVN